MKPKRAEMCLDAAGHNIAIGAAEMFYLRQDYRMRGWALGRFANEAYCPRARRLRHFFLTRQFYIVAR